VENSLELPKSLTDTIAHWIIEQMLHGELRPGDDLNIDALSRQFGVSQTPIREAIRVLQAEGLVEYLPRHSPRITPLDRKMVQDIYQCRIHMLCLSVRLAVEHITEEHIERIRAIVTPMRAMVRDQNTNAYFELSIGFTDLITGIADNSILSDIIRMLQRRSLHFRYLSLQGAGRLEAGLAFHEMMWDAFACRDSDQAEKLIKAHLFEARDVCLANLPDYI